MNAVSPLLCCGGVGCSLAGTHTPTNGTSAHGPIGVAFAMGIKPRGTVAHAIAASARIIKLRTVIVDPSDDSSAFRVRRCRSKVDNLRYGPGPHQRIGDQRPMALGRIVFKTHQRHAPMSSHTNQLIKGRLAFRCSQDIAVFRDGRLVAAPISVTVVTRVAERRQMYIVDSRLVQPRRETVLRQAGFARHRCKPHVHKDFHSCGSQRGDEVVDGAVLITDR